MTELEELCVENFRDLIYEDCSPYETVVINYLLDKGLLKLEEEGTFGDKTYHVTRKV